MITVDDSSVETGKIGCPDKITVNSSVKVEDQKVRTERKKRKREEEKSQVEDISSQCLSTAERAKEQHTYAGCAFRTILLVDFTVNTHSNKGIHLHHMTSRQSDSFRR